MRRGFVLAVTGALIITLSGCASLISRSALHPPKLNLDILPAEEIQAIGYTSGYFCQNKTTLCISYLHASAYDDDAAFNTYRHVADWQQQAPFESRAMEVRLRHSPYTATKPEVGYNIQLHTTRGNDDITLLLGSSGFDHSSARGTYVLIHGFRTNKASLFFIAETMRYEGFDVILVDLLGHGESTGQFTFSGKPDAELISALLDSRTAALTTPLHVAGMSMGGTTATHLASIRDDIQSLLLLAPMLEFVDAFADAGRAYTRSAYLVPLRTLHKSAQYALNEVQTAQEDTAVVQQVGELGIPVLILGSANDRISSLTKLQALESDGVRVHDVKPPRTHHGMILWNMDDIQVWHQWLDQLEESTQ